MALDQTDGCVASRPRAQQEAAGGGCQGPYTEDPEVSSLNHSQLATQPLDESIDMDEGGDTHPTVWGQLYPHCGTFPRIDLSQDSFSLGRGRNMEYVIRESDMGSSKWLTAVSKCQCEIIRNNTGIFIRDHSSNGTWVNGQKVGKDNLWPLEHDSEICFAGANKKVFVFRSLTEGKDVFPSELTQKYTVSKVLGRGACGEVRLGFRIPDLHRVAIKIICKRTTTVSVSKQSILNEVRILRNVNHPCIIKLEDVIDTPDFLYIVLELAEGGELFDKIIERTKFNESEAKLQFYQMASAIQYLHSKNICHRDLKPENVLLCSLDDSKPVVKITDMGLSKLLDLGTQLKTFCGTPAYLAPEIIRSAALANHHYDFKVDCWSLGVILYILLSGTPPFSEDRDCGLSLKNQILTANYIFYAELFNPVSAAAKNLIQKLLKVDPEERLSSEEILLHPWLQDTAIRQQAESLMADQKKGDVTVTVIPSSQGMKRPAPPPPPSQQHATAVDSGTVKRNKVDIKVVREGGEFNPP